jgi:hypothetical protein
MKEYKEKTAGWWLSQLKEPLRTQSFGIAEDLSKPCNSLEDAITSVLNALVIDSILWVYWRGVFVCYFGGFHIDSTNFRDGFDLAYECMPDWEMLRQLTNDAADFPPLAAPTPEFQWDDNKVIDFVTWYLKMTKLHDHRFEIENQDILDSFKRGDAPELWHQPEYPFGYTPPPPTELGENEDLTITFPAKNVLISEDEFKSKINVVTKVNPESAKITMPSNLRPGEEIQITMMSDKSTFEIVNPKEAAVEKAPFVVDMESVPKSMSTELPFGCFRSNDSITFDPSTLSFDMEQIMRANPAINFYDSTGKLLRKALVDPAVVGYEPPTPVELPKPIDTIEKKHELRIQALEAQVKDMAGEMENLIIQVRALSRQVFNTHLD